MAISGEKREQKSFDNQLVVGLAEVKVVAINPDMEEYKEILGIELKEDSKATEYLGESKDGNTTLRVNFWVEDIKSGKKFSMNYFLEDKFRTNKDNTKKQYINNIGIGSWADDVNNLPQWFTKRDYREAHVGEEELYSFLRTWINIDYSQEDAELEINWKKLMRGNVNEIKELVGGGLVGNIVILATVVSKEKDGEYKEYQGVYKEVLPAYTLKQFRLVDYSSTETLDRLKAKKPKDLKAWERFAISSQSEFGCKDFFSLKELHDYDPSENVVSGNNPIAEDDGSY